MDTDGSMLRIHEVPCRKLDWLKGSYVFSCPNQNGQCILLLLWHWQHSMVCIPNSNLSLQPLQHSVSCNDWLPSLSVLSSCAMSSASLQNSPVDYIQSMINHGWSFDGGIHVLESLTGLGWFGHTWLGVCFTDCITRHYFYGDDERKHFCVGKVFSQAEKIQCLWMVAQSDCSIGHAECHCQQWISYVNCGGW